VGIPLRTSLGAAVLVAAVLAPWSQARVPAAPPQVQALTVGTWNMAGGNPRFGDVSAAPDRLARAIRARGADFVSLQEACRHQLTRLARRLGPGYRVRLFPTGLRCDSGRGHSDHRGSAFGVGVVWRSARLSATLVTRQRLPVGPGDTQRHLLVCLAVSAPLRLTACATHFTAGDGRTDVGYRLSRIRLAQARATAAALSFPIAAGRAVVLAGDFNARPGERELDPLWDRRYGGSSAGTLVEADSGPSGARAGFARTSGRVTHHRRHASEKYDDVFVGPAVRVVGADVSRARPSDHDMLWARILG
jgi:endonuclease/exonuclease/phosphatase family metal-dependent hydrolase